jgi:hypothetical protein
MVGPQEREVNGCNGALAWRLKEFLFQPKYMIASVFLWTCAQIKVGALRYRYVDEDGIAWHLANFLLTTKCLIATVNRSFMYMLFDSRAFQTIMVLNETSEGTPNAFG